MIRPAFPEDAPQIFALVRELAEFERLAHQVSGTAEMLESQMRSGLLRCWVAVEEGETIGFALTFTNFSTFLMKPGTWLEDLYVKPDRRGSGVGRALLETVVADARERGHGRVEWAVLDWNVGAIDFYRRQGAAVLDDWRICRVTL